MKRLIVGLGALILALAFAIPVNAALGLRWAAFQVDGPSGPVLYLQPDGSNVNNRLNVYPGWDNNIEALNTEMPTNRCLVLYQGYDFNGVTYAIHGSGNLWHINLPEWMDNTASSWRHGWVVNGVCTSPWVY